MASTCGQVKAAFLIESESSSMRLGKRVGTVVPKSKLVVRLIGCHNLLPKDANGLSDPFVVLRVGAVKQKSKVVKKDLNPVFNQTFSFDVPTAFAADDVLWLTVNDWDRFQKADFIGHRQIPLCDILSQPAPNTELLLDLWPKTYYEGTEVSSKELKRASANRPRPGSAALTALAYTNASSTHGNHSLGPHPLMTNRPLAKSSSSAALLANPLSAGSMTVASADTFSHAGSSFLQPSVNKPSRESFPETPEFRLAGLILLGLSYNRSKRVLKVHAICASEVDAKDKTGLSDPYVELHLGSKVVRGPTDYKTLNPCWNHQFNLAVPPTSSTLFLSVYDWDRVGRDLIGVVNFAVQDIHGDIERWFPLNAYQSASCYQFTPPDLAQELKRTDDINRPLRLSIMRSKAQALAHSDWEAFFLKYEKAKQFAVSSRLHRGVLLFVFLFFLLTLFTTI